MVGVSVCVVCCVIRILFRHHEQCFYVLQTVLFVLSITPRRYWGILLLVLEWHDLVPSITKKIIYIIYIYIPVYTYNRSRRSSMELCVARICFLVRGIFVFRVGRFVIVSSTSAYIFKSQNIVIQFFLLQLGFVTSYSVHPKPSKKKIHHGNDHSVIL